MKLLKAFRKIKLGFIFVLIFLNIGCQIPQDSIQNAFDEVWLASSTLFIYNGRCYEVENKSGHKEISNGSGNKPQQDPLIREKWTSLSQPISLFAKQVKAPTQNQSGLLFLIPIEKCNKKELEHVADIVRNAGYQPIIHYVPVYWNECKKE